MEFEPSSRAVEAGVAFSERQMSAIAENVAVIREHESLAKARDPIAKNEKESMRQRLKVTVAPESG
jgi:hypothetical protein